MLSKKYGSNNSEWGTSFYYVPDGSVSAGAFVFHKWWLKGDNYPFGTIFVGVQPSFVQYFLNVNDIYYSTSIDFGFSPGFYREKFSINLTLRGGGGFIFPGGRWYHLGVGLQTNFSLTKNISIGGNLEAIIGIGNYVINHYTTDGVISLAPPAKLNHYCPKYFPKITRRFTKKGRKISCLFSFFAS